MLQVRAPNDAERWVFVTAVVAWPLAARAEPPDPAALETARAKLTVGAPLHVIPAEEVASHQRFIVGEYLAYDGVDHFFRHH